MARQTVASSNITSVGWENDVLEVEFKTGQVYKYFGVPTDVAESLKTADSVGQFFNSKIRGAYKFKKV